jgi:glycerophosphoryl diester phosphodiesterase
MCTAHETIAESRVLLIAHRGNSSVAPENTLQAFESALALGVDVVELDYRHTADGVPVVIHDPNFDETTDAVVCFGRKCVAVDSISLEEARKLDAGSWFDVQFGGTRLATLAEALDLITPRAIAMIERKAGDAETCVRLLREKNVVDRVVVHAFDWDFLGECHRLAPELSLGALWREPLGAETIEAARGAGASVFGWRDDRVTRQGIEQIHAAGMKVWVYTVDEVARARELIGQDVDGIISNVPQRMLEVVRGA